MPPRKKRSKPSTRRRGSSRSPAAKQALVESQPPAYTPDFDLSEDEEAFDAPEDDLLDADDAAAEPGKAAAKPEDTSWQWKWTNILRLRMQVTLSIVAGIIVALLSYRTHPFTFERFGDLSTYMATLLGIAGVLALVGSITFGFLLYDAQAIKAEQATLYATFRASVKELRTFFDELHDDGIIGGRYDYYFGLVDEVTLKKFPLLDWNERVRPLQDIIEELRYEADEDTFGRALRGFAYRVNLIEEAIQGLFKNWLGQFLVERMTEPVVKSFVTLALTMLAVLFAPLVFDRVPRTASWAVGASLAFMTFIQLVEMAMVVRREMSEFNPVAQARDNEEEEDEEEKEE